VTVGGKTLVDDVIAAAMTLKEHLCGADDVRRRVPLQERRDAGRRPSRPVPQPPMDGAINVSGTWPPRCRRRRVCRVPWPTTAVLSDDAIGAITLPVGIANVTMIRCSRHPGPGRAAQGQSGGRQCPRNSAHGGLPKCAPPVGPGRVAGARSAARGLVASASQNAPAGKCGPHWRIRY
jgi:hypothetical protein